MASQPESADFSDYNVVNHSTPRQRRRHVAGRRTVPRHKKTPSRAMGAHISYTTSFSSSPSLRTTIPAEFNFTAIEPVEPSDEVDDQMDWMGSQLAKLIEEGKRALGKEVVVMSESKEDEEDDGSGLWEDDGHDIPSSSSSGSIRRHKRPKRLGVSSPPPSYLTPQTTPRRSRFDASHSRQGSVSTPNSPSKAGRGISSDSIRSRVSTLHQEDESAWQSPELRESMERARQLYLQQRASNAS